MSENSFEMPSIANEKINIESVTKRDGTLAALKSIMPLIRPVPLPESLANRRAGC